MSQPGPQAAAVSPACLCTFANVDSGTNSQDGGIRKAALVCCPIREGFWGGGNFLGLSPAVHLA